MPHPDSQPEFGAQRSGDSRAAAAKLYAQGHILARQGLWPDAEAAFHESARLAPDASLTWLSAAIAVWQQKRPLEAAVAIEWALHAIPIRDTPESQKGIKCFEAEDWRGVEEAFRALLTKGSPETPTHLFLTIALIRIGRFDEAWDQLMAAYKLELGDAEWPNS